MQLGIDVDTHVARAAILDANGHPRLLASLPALARQTMHGLVFGVEAAQSLAGLGSVWIAPAGSPAVLRA